MTYTRRRLVVRLSHATKSYCVNRPLECPRFGKGIAYDSCCLSQDKCVVPDNIHILDCVVPEKIYTHPMEGHQKFLGGGGS